MPRPKKEPAEGAEPKKRSRTGCWPCKARKVKCGEEKPSCANCVKSGEACDYSIRLNWGGRGRRDGTPTDPGSFTFVGTPPPGSHPTHAKTHSNGGQEHIFSAQHIVSGPPPRQLNNVPSDLPSPGPDTPGSDGAALDPRLRLQPQISPTDFQSTQLPSFAYNSSFNPAWQRSPPATERSPPTSVPTGDASQWSPENSAKRVKLSNAHPSPVFAVPQYPTHLDASPGSTYHTPHSISSIVNTPATPGSTISSGSPFPLHPQPLVGQDPPDLRRLSVKSLLSDPSEDADRPRYPALEVHGGWRTYGYDHGFPDLDVPNNDDGNVIQPKSPDLRRASVAFADDSSSSSESDNKLIAFEPGGYYAQPVPIKLPRSLEPIPAELKDNQMNLLYFHHFINHTARILVPHDCPENPLRGVLPQMAVRNQHLLHLMLAYSASHRSRLLGHPEPKNRIAAWLSDVFPALRQAIAEPSSPGPADPTDPSSLAPLATAIMFASLNIVSPDSFEITIPWQQHLNIAKEIIIAKGGLDRLAKKADGAKDKAIWFLSRWFAYLDVLGSLSSGLQEQPLYGAYLEDGGGWWLVNRTTDEELYQIDCFFGFSGRCISLLAQVAELAAQCDLERIDQATREVIPGWEPTESVQHEAEDLKKRLLESATTHYQGCTHSNPNSTAPEAKSLQDLDEICATNELYHWGGIIHLLRRVLGLPTAHPQVQEGVSKVLELLQKVRRGSSAESCLLFPMFSAGCEALTQEQRDVFTDRLQGVERWGMDQVGRARVLMQVVWETGKPWETLVNGEFFG